MTVREAGPFEKVVLVELSDAEIDAAKAAAARRLSKDLKIHGFRPGKAPRPVVEAAIGSDRLRSEAIEDLIPQQLRKVLEEHELFPVITPRLETVNDVDGGIQAEVLVTLWPTLDEPPRYREREIQVPASELTEEDVQSSIERMRNQFATLETADRPAEQGDFVSIDLSATDGTEPIPGTVANEFLYEVGSGHLFEGTDEQILGMSAGEEATFETQLGTRDEEPRDVTVTVKVNEVKAKLLPGYDDEWVSEVTEFDTVAEFEERLRSELATSKRRAVARELRQAALDLLIHEAGVAIPDQLLAAEMDDLLRRFLAQLGEDEISLEDYLEVTGLSQEQLRDDLRVQADHGIKGRLVLESIAKEEGIEVDPADIAAQIEAMARASKDPQRVYEIMRDESRVLAVAGDILRSKALEAVVARVKPIDEDGNPVELGTEIAPEEVEALPLPDEVVVEAEIVDEEA